MEYKIKIELAQAVLNYLAGRPYGEVFELVQKLQKLEKIIEEKKDETKTVGV
jgi:hypothetical protein